MVHKLKGGARSSTSDTHAGRAATGKTAQPVRPPLSRKDTRLQTALDPLRS